MTSFIPPDDQPIVSYMDRLCWRQRRPRIDTGIAQSLTWTTDILDTHPLEAMNISMTPDQGWQLLIYRRNADPTSGKVNARVLGHYDNPDDAKAAAEAHIAKGPIPR